MNNLEQICTLRHSYVPPTTFLRHLPFGGRGDMYLYISKYSILFPHYNIVFNSF